jgi:hypothetical protein
LKEPANMKSAADILKELSKKIELDPKGIADLFVKFADAVKS